MKINDCIKISGIHTFTFRDANTGKIKKQFVRKNVICAPVKEMIATELAGGAGSHNITYGAVGTGAGTPASTDTTLFTEIDRVAVASISSSAGVVSVSVFFGASDGNGVLTNYGLFGGTATATTDSGEMVNHVTISETKTSSETLTIDSTITIS